MKKNLHWGFQKISFFIFNRKYGNKENSIKKAVDIIWLSTKFPLQYAAFLVNPKTPKLNSCNI